MRLPSVRAALIIYGSLILISKIPVIATYDFFFEHQWLGLPFALAGLMIPAAAFLAVFVIDNKLAWLVPVAGVFSSALIGEYLRRVPDEVKAQFEQGAFQVSLREVLWEAIRNPLIEYGALAGLALIAARFWTRRLQPNAGPAQVELPPRRQVIAVAALLLVGYVISDHLLSSNLVEGYVPGRLVGVVQLAAQAAFFVLAVTIFSGWVALFPLAVIVSTTTLFATSNVLAWDNFGWSAVKYTTVLLALEFVIFMAAAWWSRGDAAPSGTDPVLVESPA